jgi:hypothetical protein
MDNDNNESVTINGVNPDILWAQHIDYLFTQSRILEKEYRKRKSADKSFTWKDLYEMNAKIRYDLDVIMSGDI